LKFEQIPLLNKPQSVKLQALSFTLLLSLWDQLLAHGLYLDQWILLVHEQLVVRQTGASTR
jgi:hypothetical protein